MNHSSRLAGMIKSIFYIVSRLMGICTAPQRPTNWFRWTTLMKCCHCYYLVWFIEWIYCLMAKHFTQAFSGLFSHARNTACIKSWPFFSLSQVNFNAAHDQHSLKRISNSLIMRGGGVPQEQKKRMLTVSRSSGTSSNFLPLLIN